MAVVLINFRRPFMFNGYRRHTRVDKLKLVFGLVVTCWMPTLMFCITVGEVLPFFLMFACEMFGTCCGLLMYLRTPNRIDSCVPETQHWEMRPTRPQDKHAA